MVGYMLLMCTVCKFWFNRFTSFKYWRQQDLSYSSQLKSFSEAMTLSCKDEMRDLHHIFTIPMWSKWLVLWSLMWNMSKAIYFYYKGSLSFGVATVSIRHWKIQCNFKVESNWNQATQLCVYQSLQTWTRGYY